METSATEGERGQPDAALGGKGLPGTALAQPLGACVVLREETVRVQHGRGGTGPRLLIEVPRTVNAYRSSPFSVTDRWKTPGWGVRLGPLHTVTARVSPEAAMPGERNHRSSKVPPGRGSKAKLQPGPARPTLAGTSSSHVTVCSWGRRPDPRESTRRQPVPEALLQGADALLGRGREPR
ncbi:hypothetical protein ACWCQW_28790 [Streptomyces mirabilis]